MFVQNRRFICFSRSLFPLFILFHFSTTTADNVFVSFVQQSLLYLIELNRNQYKINQSE